MKCSTLLLVFSSAIVLQACRHPLAIEGEGDIVESNDSGRGCTLEQFQAGDLACVGNEFTDDYHVNYKAVPRPGWRFVRWEGPCSARSAFQYCTLNITPDDVAWWDENYPDEELPASTAVFAPVTGETGYLLGPGAAVAGVSYETATQQGVTGLDGSFQYEEGEVVRFTIGATLLGEALGKPQVTPFGLAGSPALTGMRITWALQEDREGSQDPFHAVINLSVLLQSLDRDGDAVNGIEITSGVASLLSKVKLNLLQRWEAFQLDPTFHHMMGRANRKKRFSHNHGIAKPVVVIDSLYATLGVDPQTIGVSLLRTVARGEEGTSDFVQTFTYQADGNLARHEDTAHGEDAFEFWKYDASGSVIRHEQHAPQFGFFRVDVWEYDASGNTKTYEVNSSGHFSPPHELSNYFYDEDGNSARVETVRYREEGDVESVWTYQYDFDRPGNLRTLTKLDDDPETLIYDANGNLIQVDRAGLDGPSASPFLKYEYDSSGNLVRYEFLPGGDTPALLDLWEYDAEGNLIRHENISSIKYYSHTVSVMEYDVEGNLIYRESVNQETNAVADTTRWEYDDSGNVVIRAQVNFGYDREEILETWQYDRVGRTTRYECTAESGDCDNIFADQVSHRVDEWTYHANGVVDLHVSESTDAAGDSGVKLIRQLRYDQAGNLVADESNSGRYGGPGWALAWSYDEAGNLVREEVDEYGDGVAEEVRTYEYVPTGWGHLFSGVEIFGFTTPYGVSWVPPLKPVPRGE